MMRYWKLILPTLLIAVMVFGLTNSVSAQPSAPKISIRPSILYVTPCTNFKVEIWITGIPDGSEMTAIDNFGVHWDIDLMESIPEGQDYFGERGWTLGSGAGGDDWFVFDASGPGWTEDAPWLELFFHCIAEGTSTIETDITSIELLNTGTETVDPDGFVATVHQRSPNVGGTFIAANKLTILAPYLGLVGLVAAITTVVVIVKRRKN